MGADPETGNCASTFGRIGREGDSWRGSADPPFKTRLKKPPFGMPDVGESLALQHYLT